MNIRTVLLAAALIAAAGCEREQAGTVGPDHPASPRAAEAPAPEPSRTLDTSAPGTMPSQQATGSGASGDMAGMSHTAHAQPSTTQSAALYTCPMHPDVLSATPGKCPKCGMKLVKKTQP